MARDWWVHRIVRRGGETVISLPLQRISEVEVDGNLRRTIRSGGCVTAAEDQILAHNAGCSGAYWSTYYPVEARP